MEASPLVRRGGLAFPRSRRLLGAFPDDRLVDQLRRGNDVAFEVIYDRHHRRILSFCRHMLGSREEAEDAVQQTFISAYHDLASGDREINLKPWLFTIARNRCLSMLRARREQANAELEPSTAGLAEEAQHRADLRELLSDLAELPEEQRAALVLSELGDLSHADVAQIVGCPVTKVKSLVYQARSGLHERRDARETPCREIREQLATLRGGSLRRGVLRRHLQRCPPCTEFRSEVLRQRQAMAILLPVVPSFGLKEGAMAAVGLSGGAGGLAAGGGAGGAALLGNAGIAKLLVGATVLGTATAGGLAVSGGGDDESSRRPAVEAAPVPALTSGAPAAPASNGSEKRASGTTDSANRARQGGKGRSERGSERGFTPVPGESNGERARDFAKTRGQGQKKGLYKPPERRTPPAYGKTNTPAERGADDRALPVPSPEARKPANVEDRDDESGSD